MSLDASDALSEGIDQVTTQAAAVLFAFYAIVSAVQTAATQDIVRELILDLREWAEDELTAEEYQEFVDATEPALNDLHLALGLDLLPAILLFFVAAVAGVAIVAVAIDAFASGARSVDDIDASGVLWHTLNLVFGGILFAILFLIGFSFFVLPGFVVLFLFVFFPVAVVVDDDNFFSAFGSSIETVTDDLFQSFLLVVLIVVIGLVLGLVSSLVTALVPGVAGTLLGVAVTAVSSLFGIAILTRAYVGDEAANDEPVDDPAESWG